MYRSMFPFMSALVGGKWTASRPGSFLPEEVDPAYIEHEAVWIPTKMNRNTTINRKQPKINYSSKSSDITSNSVLLPTSILLKVYNST
jgi:hypothetical protein